MTPKAAAIIARTVVVLWAAFWTFFCVASALGEKEGLVGGLMHQVPAVVMIVSAAAAWRWAKPGGVLLIAEGIFVVSGLWVRPSIPLFAMLGLPPVVAGLLFLISVPSAGPGVSHTGNGPRPGADTGPSSTV